MTLKNLMSTMEINYKADDWRLFIDSSKHSLKTVFYTRRIKNHLYQSLTAQRLKRNMKNYNLFKKKQVRQTSMADMLRF